MGLAHFIYTTLLKPAPLKNAANRMLLALLPARLHVGKAILCLNPRDPVISGSLTLGIYERGETAFFQRTCREGMTLCDIGANIGLYSALALPLLGKTGTLLAVEPHAESLNYLHQTLEATAQALPSQTCPSITVVAAAASDAFGAAPLYANPDNKGDNRLYPSKATPAPIGQIRLDTLDRLATGAGLDHVDYLKIDVQGSEYQVLKGAQNLLENSPRCILLCEFWPLGLEQASHIKADAFLSYLESLGFTLYILRGQQLKALAKSDWPALIGKLRGVRYGTVIGLKNLSPQALH